MAEIRRSNLQRAKEAYELFIRDLPEDWGQWEAGWFWEAMKHVTRWREETKRFYEKALESARKRGGDVVRDVMRGLCLDDLWFLMVYVMNLGYMDNNWSFLRCREVETDPDGNLDLWARGHMKTTIITEGKTIQDILRNPNETVCIFSCTRPLAKKPLNFIKRELEGNDTLKSLFNDVLWENPSRDAPKWSEDSGLIVKRSMNSKEATLEAWGLIDSQPTGPHYSLVIYDDVVSPQLTNTADIIQQVVTRWELSLNLGIPGQTRRRYIGTRYSLNDAYETIMDRKAASPRIHPARLGGTPEGELVFFTEDQWTDWIKGMTPRTIAAQMYQNPQIGAVSGIEREWVERRRWAAEDPANLNFYLLVDPAGSKKKDRDRTAFWVVGIGPDENFYIFDGEVGRWDYAERKRMLYQLVAKYKPLITFYECMGKDAEVDAIIDDQHEKKFHFDIEKVNDRTPKHERIEAFADLCQAGKIWWPEQLMKRADDGQYYDLIKRILEDEVYRWPNIVHDDALDGLANLARPCVRNLMQPPVLPGRIQRIVPDFDPREIEEYEDILWR